MSYFALMSAIPLIGTVAIVGGMGAAVGLGGYHIWKKISGN